MYNARECQLMRLADKVADNYRRGCIESCPVLSRWEEVAAASESARLDDPNHRRGRDNSNTKYGPAARAAMTAVEAAILEAEPWAAMTTKLPATVEREGRAVFALLSLNIRFGLGRCGECPQCKNPPRDPGIVNWYVVNLCRVELARLEAYGWLEKQFES